jgi:hypothetical protein
MKIRHIIPLLFVASCCVASAQTANILTNNALAQKSTVQLELTTNIDEALTSQALGVWFRASQIHPGMTRADLNKVFKEDPGCLNCPKPKPYPFAPMQRFAYRSCDYILVDVEFKPSDFTNAQPKDIITKISPPFIVGPVIN